MDKNRCICGLLEVKCWLNGYFRFICLMGCLDNSVMLINNLVFSMGRLGNLNRWPVYVCLLLLSALSDFGGYG